MIAKEAIITAELEMTYFTNLTPILDVVFSTPFFHNPGFAS